VVVLSYYVRIEAHFEFKLLFWLQSSFGHFNVEDTIFFDLFIIQVPIDILLINVADGHINELGITSVRLCYYFSFEVYDRRFEQKLRVYAFTLDARNIIYFDWFFYWHGNLHFIFSCLFWEKLSIEFIYFFRFEI